MSCDKVTRDARQDPAVSVLPPRELTREAKARLHEHRANKVYFQEHHAQIAEEHPQQELLVYGGAHVAAFESLDDLFAFRERLDQPTREASYHPHRGWSGNTGPTFRVAR